MTWFNITWYASFFSWSCMYYFKLNHFKSWFKQIFLYFLTDHLCIVCYNSFKSRFYAISYIFSMTMFPQGRVLGWHFIALLERPSSIEYVCWLSKQFLQILILSKVLCIFNIHVDPWVGPYESRDKKNVYIGWNVFFNWSITQSYKTILSNPDCMQCIFYMHATGEPRQWFF